jgi:hypothetical protein
MTGSQQATFPTCGPTPSNWQLVGQVWKPIGNLATADCTAPLHFMTSTGRKIIEPGPTTEPQPNEEFNGLRTQFPGLHPSQGLDDPRDVLDLQAKFPGVVQPPFVPDQTRDGAQLTLPMVPKNGPAIDIRPTPGASTP